MSFSDLPTGARRLIFYYSLSVASVSVDLLVPVYLFALGIEIPTVGVLYAILFSSSLVGRLVFGTLLDILVPPKYLVFVIELSGSVSWILMALSGDVRVIVVAFIIQGVVEPLYVAYPALERDLYPQDKLELAYKFHMMLPYAAQFVALLIYGALLEFLPIVLAFRILFMFCAVLCSSLALYVLVALPETRPTGVSSGITKHLTEELVLVSSAYLLVIGGFAVAPFFVLEHFMFNVIATSPALIALVYALGALLGFAGAVLYGELQGVGSFRRVVIGLLTLTIAAILMQLALLLEIPLALSLIHI